MLESKYETLLSIDVLKQYKKHVI